MLTVENEVKSRFCVCLKMSAEHLRIQLKSKSGFFLRNIHVRQGSRITFTLKLLLSLSFRYTSMFLSHIHF